MPLLFAVVLSYIGFLTILATVSPGGGLLGLILLLFPSQLLDSFHAPAYGLLAWIGITALQQRGWPRTLALCAGSLFALGFGFWTEILQMSVPGRGFEIKDLLIDGVGIAMAGMMAARQSISMRATSAAETERSNSVTTLEEPA